jgi:homoserine kinase
MTFAAGPARVRVPATSANLGPGFDALGLALALHDELSAQVADAGLRVEVTGEGGELVARDETHLVVRAMRAAFAAMGVEPAGLSLHCTNRIPHSRGLGSSAAAIVGGVLLARALVVGGDGRLADADVLALASELEGHPDNVAPCLLGGLTVAWLAGGAARAVRRDVDPAIVPVALVPPFTASTEQARGLLPASVPHRDAAANAGRAALLVAALTGTPQALLDATEDRLHQGYRASAMPESAALVDRLRAAGHPAVISGAGPTVLVLARGDVEAEAVDAAAPAGWLVLRPGVDAAGAVVRP